jgi:hypothetical protein
MVLRLPFFLWLGVSRGVVGGGWKGNMDGVLRFVCHGGSVLRFIDLHGGEGDSLDIGDQVGVSAFGFIMLAHRIIHQSQSTLQRGLNALLYH